MACCFTWVVSILTSLLRVQTMENCSWLVNFNTELGGLPFLIVTHEASQIIKSLYTLTGKSQDLAASSWCSKSGTRLPSEEKSKYQGKQHKKFSEQSKVNLMGDWDEGKRGHSFSAYCSLRNEMEQNKTKWNETKWKSVVCEMRICSLRNLDYWCSCKLSPRSPFKNSRKGCYEVVWSRQLLLLN